jgi:hypothetical protein
MESDYVFSFPPVVLVVGLVLLDLLEPIAVVLVVAVARVRLSPEH